MKKYIYTLKERTGLEDLTNDQIKAFKKLIKKAKVWQKERLDTLSNRIGLPSMDEISKMWNVDNYELDDSEKARLLKGADKLTIFSNLNWIYRNIDKMDEKKKSILGSHIWLVKHWMEKVGTKKVQDFLRYNGYDNDFIFFLYRNFKT